MDASIFVGNLNCQPAAANLRDLLNKIVKERPEHIAYYYRRQSKGASISVSYRELLNRCDNLALALLQAPFMPRSENVYAESGVRKLPVILAAETGDKQAKVSTAGDKQESCIGIIGLNSVDWVVAQNAAIFSGRLAVPLDKQLSEKEVRQLLRKAGIKSLFIDASFTELITNLLAEPEAVERLILMGVKSESYADASAFLDSLKLASCQTASTNELPLTAAQNAQMPPVTHNNVQLYLMRDLEKQGAVATAEVKAAYANLALPGEAACAIYFTSGTSAQSKGVMLSHYNHLYGISAVQQADIITPRQVALSVLPMHHIFENAAQYIFWSLDTPIAINCNLRYISYNLQAWPISVMLCVPLLLENIQKQILTAVRKQGKSGLFNLLRKVSRSLLKIGIDLRPVLFAKVRAQVAPKLQTFVVGAAALKEDCEQFFNDLGFETLVGYGMTETSPIITANPSGATRFGSVGKILPHFKVVLDQSGFSGGEGEICVQGPSVMLRYYQDEIATELSQCQLAEQKGKFLRTGDVGRLSDDGYLYITGRVKSMIVLDSGKKVFPEELEVLLSGMNNCKESFVFSLANTKGQTELAACFVLQPEAELAAARAEVAACLQALEQQIPNYKKIQYYILSYSDLTHTTTLKIKRAENIERIRQALERGNLSLKECNGKVLEF